MWIRNYKHSEDLVRWWLFFQKALAFVISTPFVFRKGYFQMVLPSFVTLPFHPPPPPPLKPLSNSWDVWESLSAIMSDVGSVYNTCAKGMKSGKICSDFAFTVVKIYTIFFSEAIGDPLMCVITLATMCILFLSEVRHRTFLLTSVQSQNNAICLQLDALSGSLRQNNHVGLMLFFKNVFRNLFMD